MKTSSLGNHEVLPLVGNSVGCLAFGERLVLAAQDVDLQEARMLHEYNPWMARYSTFDGRNSLLHNAGIKVTMSSLLLAPMEGAGSPATTEADSQRAKKLTGAQLG